MKARGIVVAGILGAVLVGSVWLFPRVWYSRGGEGKPAWLGESTNVAGWTFEEVPITKTEEVALDADVTLSGTFAKGRERVSVFSAKRFSDDPDEIGLFVHTPDRCWVQVGWKIETADPDFVEIEAGGVGAVAERRIFRWKSGERQLVYFWGLSGGRALPYRLDHNLSIAHRQLMKSSSTAGATRARAFDGQFWGRIWDCFRDRRQRTGPKQFFRMATPISGTDIVGADARLKETAKAWLGPVDFDQDVKAFEARSRVASAK